MPGFGAPARTTTTPAGTSNGATCGAILVIVAGSHPVNSGVVARNSAIAVAGTSTRRGLVSPSVVIQRIVHRTGGARCAIDIGAGRDQPGSAFGLAGSSRTVSAMAMAFLARATI